MDFSFNIHLIIIKNNGKPLTAHILRPFQFKDELNIMVNVETSQCFLVNLNGLSMQNSIPGVDIITRAPSIQKTAKARRGKCDCGVKMWAFVAVTDSLM